MEITKPIIFDINGKWMTEKQFNKKNQSLVCSALVKNYPYKTDFDTHVLRGITYVGKESYFTWKAEKSISETNNVAKDNPALVKKINKLFEESRSETDGFPYGGVIQN